MIEESSEKPKVSIIIPTYNSEKTLFECLKSVYSQSYPFYEVIIVDNYSTDGTLDIAKKFGVKIIQAKSNPARARNIGIANSAGKYILFVDSDQILSPSVIEDCVKKCEKEKAGMAKIPEIFVGKRFWGYCSAVWKNYYEKIGQIYGKHESENVIRGEPRFFAKKELFYVGLLDSTLHWGEDYNLYEKLRMKHVKEVICRSKIYHKEPASLKKILIKNFSYGRSLPMFLQKTDRKVFTLLVRQAFLTLSLVFVDFFRKKPAIILGCSFLLFLKACFLFMGLFSGYVTRDSQ